MRFIDLFAGTGAFSHVLVKKGCECVFANDRIESSKEIYNKNHHDHPFVLGDLTDMNVHTIPEHDLLCAGFPCFVEGTMVLTNHGYKRIEEVSLDDKLLTHTGNFQPILNLQSKLYTGTLYHIALQYHPDPIVCTEEHPFYVRTRQRKWNNSLRRYEYTFHAPEWKKASDITCDDYFGMVINTHSILPTSTNHEKKIPEWIHDAPVEYIREFLNRCETNHGKTAMVSHDVALGLQRLYLKSGQIVSVDRVQECYCVRKVVEHPCAFMDNGYAWFPQKDQDRSMEHTTNRRVYNFEVEQDNSYIVSNTIVHNCQPFSVAGQRKGFNDPRSNVFWKIMEIVNHHKPSIILLENVKNLRTHDQGRTLQIILSSLSEAGYHVKHAIVDTANVTHVPQHRERIYIVGFRDKPMCDLFEFDFPPVQNRPILDFLETNVPAKYYYTDRLQVFDIIRQSVTKPIATTNTVYQYRRYYVRENKNNQCPTLTANMGSGGHNVPLVLDANGIRKLTPKECFLLQGFPTDYIIPPTLSDSALYKLAGNAVSVPVVNLLVEKLLALVK